MVYSRGRALVAHCHRPAEGNKLEKLLRERQRAVAVGVAESEKAEEAFGPHQEGTNFLFC